MSAIKVAVFSFVRPLLVVTGPNGPMNKVIVVTKEPTKAISIVASLGDRTIDQSFAGLPNGGSATSFVGYLNVDRSGCWQFDITYNGQSDTLYLYYF